jgi:hypothetical protein
MMEYKKHYRNLDKEKRGAKRASVTRGSRNPKHGKGKHYIVHRPSISKYDVR